MLKILFHLIKFTIIGYWVIFCLDQYDKQLPFYFQNILFWVFVFIPCLGFYENVISIITKKVFSKFIKEENILDKPKKTFQEKLDEKMNQIKKS